MSIILFLKSVSELGMCFEKLSSRIQSITACETSRTIVYIVYMLWFNLKFGLNFLKRVFFFQTSLFFSNQFNYGPGVQGWRRSESTRLSPMRSRFDSQTRRHMWVELNGTCTVVEFVEFESAPRGFLLVCTPLSPFLKDT